MARANRLMQQSKPVPSSLTSQWYESQMNIKNLVKRAEKKSVVSRTIQPLREKEAFANIETDTIHSPLRYKRKNYKLIVSKYVFYVGQIYACQKSVNRT